MSERRQSTVAGLTLLTLSVPTLLARATTSRSCQLSKSNPTSDPDCPSVDIVHLHFRDNLLAAVIDNTEESEQPLTLRPHGH
ncbi:uncharacterized protein LOC112495286 isoform X2 [Cephus cinctus]|uniref:Uncharacterized protein LOC112495286 isoform X2 n=1 Tax=Cephus cinctus TaxID=211228 RepID=A0AAJ7W725_CEPCN|nr:uncharacterized protein LOC112495286 isoform X2 [Cephus cinctus]